MSYRITKKQYNGLKYCDRCIKKNPTPEHIKHLDVVEVLHIPTSKKETLCKSCYTEITGLNIEIKE